MILINVYRVPRATHCCWALWVTHGDRQDVIAAQAIAFEALAVHLGREIMCSYNLTVL